MGPFVLDYSGSVDDKIPILSFTLKKKPQYTIQYNAIKRNRK